MGTVSESRARQASSCSAAWTPELCFPTQKMIIPHVPIIPTEYFHKPCPL